MRPYVLAGSGTLLAIAVLVLPAGLRGLQRRRRLADGGAGALWDELGATAADLGVRLHPAWTPRRTAEELGRGMTSSRGIPDPAAVEAVHRLALAEERSSYGPAGSGAGGPELATALRLARRALGRGCTRSTRLRATLWPASLVGGAGRRLATGVTDRLGGPVRRRRSSRETRPA